MGNMICGAGLQLRRIARFASPTAFLTAILVVPFAEAQEANRQLLIEYITPSPLCEPWPATNSLSLNQRSDTTNDEAAALKVQSPRKSLTSGERWENFECEFGIPHKDPSRFKASIETVKYRLDRTLFGVQEIVQGFQNVASFDYELRSVGRSSSSTNRLMASSVPIPLWDTMERARFRSDIDVNMGAGRAFVGVQLVLPIGN